jgi:hypothetical protein
MKKAEIVNSDRVVTFHFYDTEEEDTIEAACVQRSSGEWISNEDLRPDAIAELAEGEINRGEEEVAWLAEKIIRVRREVELIKSMRDAAQKDQIKIAQDQEPVKTAPYADFYFLRLGDEIVFYDAGGRESLDRENVANGLAEAEKACKVLAGKASRKLNKYARKAKKYRKLIEEIK